MMLKNALAPTSEWGVGDRCVIKEPCGLHSVHPPALNADGHSALLTHNHSWWKDDPRHVQGLLLLWIAREWTDWIGYTRRLFSLNGLQRLQCLLCVHVILQMRITAINLQTMTRCGLESALTIPGSDSPSLLLHEKPKQRRKTNTKEIHIMATDALADLVNSGGSSENEKWQEWKGQTSSWMKKAQQMVTGSPDLLSCCSPLPIFSQTSYL